MTEVCSTNCKLYSTGFVSTYTEEKAPLKNFPRNQMLYAENPIQGHAFWYVIQGDLRCRR